MSNFGFSSFRRDIELPHVVSSGEESLEELTRLIEATVSFELPGFAIVETDIPTEKDVEKIHEEHEQLILSALSATVPYIKHKDTFQSRHTVDFGESTEMHMDLGGMSLGGLYLIMRLHTPVTVGTHAILANGKNIPDHGDKELFSDRGYANYRVYNMGYDADRMARIDETIAAVGFGDSTAPEYCDSTVYHFDQMVGTSIFFRSMTGIGPATSHGFTSVDTSKLRNNIVSDLWIGTSGTQL